MTEEVILNPPKIDIKLKPENVDIAYPPLFQSGGHFELKLNTQADDNPLHGGETAGRRGEGGGGSRHRQGMGVLDQIIITST
jgi:hypothetical protein